LKNKMLHKNLWQPSNFREIFCLKLEFVYFDY